jgi:hypothetical protein
MRLLAYSGRDSEALLQYETCRRLLVEELGAEPSAETIGLCERIRHRTLPFPIPSTVRLQGNEAQAEAGFDCAIEVTCRQQAKSWELRATVILCRLWQKQGRSEEAHPPLAEIHGWFAEGFHTPDLKEAEALLEELSWTLCGQHQPRGERKRRIGYCTPLRKDALRQRPVGPRLPVRLAGDGRAVLPHYRLGCNCPRG